MDPAVNTDAPPVQPATCPKCGIAVGDRVFQGDVPFDGKHLIDVTNGAGARLVVRDGVIREYAPCGHLLVEEPFPTTINCDHNVEKMGRGRERAETIIATARAGRQTSSH